MSSNLKPFVSVVVPVYNGGEGTAKCIESLLNQDYDKDKYEIIIVDNNSTDNTREVIKKYPVTMLEEKFQTSSAARNTGIRSAKGEVLAFTDIDCVPTPSWISGGVLTFSETGADVLGGKVEFLFSKTRTAAELVDSIINLNNEYSLEFRHTAKTANIFTYKRVMDKIGLFHQEQSSGNDTEWTYRAWRSECYLAYAPKAVILHRARSFKELMKKHFRVGTGSMAVWRSANRNLLWIFVRFLSLFLPLLSFKLIYLIKKYGHKEIRYPVVQMMGIAYLCTVATGCGIIKTYLKRIL